ncbi:hypothetical protein F5883DRAFT_572609 [Diaporthe sp. PMI_573]|nr:hypothetical protein F5883DRAFT_572609 [Diaporthaceae sp. PMI_573]
MKLSLLALAAAAGLASCQCPSSIPECAQSCLMIAADSVGCGETDYACQCADAHQQDITTNATTCVLAACGEQTALNEVLPAASAFCSAINAGVSCSDASAGSTAAPSGSSTSASVSLLPTTDSETTVSPTITGTGASSTASETATTTAESSGSGSATGASATASSTAGAATLGSVGSLGIAVLGALVML